VIEIKDDDEVIHPANFINGLQNETMYHFHFLTPQDYDRYFEHVRDRNYSFLSRPDVILSENGV